MMQYSMTKFMSQSHPIPAYTHFCTITNTAFTRNRHDVLRELGLGVDASEVSIVNYEKDKLFSAIKG